MRSCTRLSVCVCIADINKHGEHDFVLKPNYPGYECCHLVLVSDSAQTMKSQYHAYIGLTISEPTGGGGGGANDLYCSPPSGCSQDPLALLLWRSHVHLYTVSGLQLVSLATHFLIF